MSALPLAVPTAAPRWPWVRDFALVGGVTGFCAPYTMLRELEYSALAAAGGLVGGAALGLFSSWLISRYARRWRRFVLFPLGLFFGALWGAMAGGTTALVPSLRSLLVLSLLCAAIAGSVQLGWFWFAYSVRRVNHRSTWPVVLGASVLSVGLGFVGVVVVTSLF